MKKLACLLTVVFLSFGATAAFAQSAKFAAEASKLTAFQQPIGTLNWTTVLQTTIKTPNKKDLLVGASFQTGLYTQTQVKGKNGSTTTATANATLKVRLLVDGDIAYPGDVVYDARSQTLTATLGGVIESCKDLNGDGVIIVKDECVVTDEMIELILSTMAAHHYNFVYANLTPGTHTVEVQVNIATPDGTVTDGNSASAWATFGPGSLTVEEVRATNIPDGITFSQ